MFSPNDIQIFVLTYNRAEMLRETLESLHAQTVQGFTIHVLDNGSEDHTADVVASYPNVSYFRHPQNNGWQANCDKARELANREWVMLFHDDDLMHPQCIELMLAALNLHPEETVLIGTGYTPTHTPDATVWQTPQRQYYHCSSVADFAGLLYGGTEYHLGSSLIRRELFINTPNDFETYGVVQDRPHLYAMATHGHTLVLDDPLVQYRLHEKQITHELLDLKYIRNLQGCYQTILKASPKKEHHRLYDLLSLTFARNALDWLSITDKTAHKGYERACIQEGIYSSWMLVEFKAYKLFKQRVAYFKKAEAFYKSFKCSLLHSF